MPLVPGTLLTPYLVGEAAIPPPGKVAASLALKPGQYPQGLASGVRVAVYISPTGPDDQPVPASSAAGTPPVRLAAVVLGVDLAGDGQGSTVVTVLLDEADGPTLAVASTGGVMLMQTAAGGA